MFTVTVAVRISPTSQAASLGGAGRIERETVSETISDGIYGATVSVRLPTPPEALEAWKDEYLGAECGYHVAGSGVLTVHGTSPAGVPIWRVYAPGQWLSVRALIPPDALSAVDGTRHTDTLARGTGVF